MKENKKKRPSLFSALFGSRNKNLDVYKEEAVQSPGMTMFKNFLSNKIAMSGVILFFATFITCFAVPFFIEIDPAYTDITQQNVAPGLNMMSVPVQLESDLAVISPGSTYGAGVTNSGALYMYGQFTDDKMVQLPSDMGKLVDVSAGQNHLLALNDQGELFTWGFDRFGLGQIPSEVENFEGNIKDIGAVYQLSYALSDQGELAYWGNENILTVNGLSDYQGNIAQAEFNTATGMILTEDKEVVVLLKTDTPLTRIPEEIQGKVIDIALSDKNAAAITEDGKMHVWGDGTAAAATLPEEYSDVKFSIVEGGRSHFTALSEDGTVYSWGDNNHGQTDVPSGLTSASEIFTDFHQNYAIDANGTLHSWGLEGYIMGSDGVGRDVFLRVVSGGRMTMTVGALAIVISTFIGVIVGGVSGYYGGTWIDTLLMRVAEVVGNLPFLPFAMILSAILGNTVSETGRILLIMVILGILGWTGLARMLRAQILAEREKEFVTAAKALGIREGAIIFKHILPNVLSLLIVSTTLGFASSMLTESALSFIGFGVTEPNPTWGNMLNQALDSQVMIEFWWQWIFPALALCISVVSINNIGDGLRDAIDPHSNDR